MNGVEAKPQHRNCRLALLVFGVVWGLGPISAKADMGGPDAFGYTFIDSNEPGGPAFNFEDISGSGTFVSLSDDSVSGAIPIGFTFNYYGINYTSIFISSNGFLTVLGGQSSGCCTGQPLPSGGAPNGTIAGWWEDLCPPCGGGAGLIHHQILGTAPNRRFIVQFTDMPHFASGNAVTFQWKLFETAQSIEVHYQAAPSDGGQHSVGIENESGAIGLQYFFGGSPLNTPLAVRFSVRDCNSNGVPDACDIDCGINGGPCDVPGCGQSADCNINGIPDECELGDNDCNNNGIPDECDIADETSDDCNLNGIPDECEAITDCNANDIPDECDIGRGVSEDCNVNGVPDECESPDCPASLDRISINGGGTLSTAGPYALIASTGQPGGVGVISSESYELADGFWHAAAPGCGPCPTDVDGNGETEAFDLANLLGKWGPVTPAGACLDADGNGFIEAFDLAVLLGKWGPCQ